MKKLDEDLENDKEEFRLLLLDLQPCISGNVFHQIQESPRHRVEIMMQMGSDRPCNLNREGPLLPTPPHLLSVRSTYTPMTDNSYLTSGRLFDGGYCHCPRPKFPIFNGKDIHGWLYRIEQLLDFYGISLD